MFGPYVLVFGGLALGLFIGGILVGTDPAFAGFLFGGGAGLTFGAWMAALTSNEQLLGGGRRSRSRDSLPPHMRAGTLTGPPLHDHETEAVEQLRREGTTARTQDDAR